MSRHPLADAGSLRPTYDAVAWERTPLGPVQTWSDEFCGALSLVLTTRFPATLFYGPEHVLLYNESYVALIGDKHPSGLGQPVEKVFPEVWDAIEPMISNVVNGGGANWIEDSRMLLHRRGFLEECFFTFSYSPIVDRTGRIVGVLDVATETTRRVIDRRRLMMISRLTALTADPPPPGALNEVVLELLRRTNEDWAEIDILDVGDVAKVPSPDGLVFDDSDGSHAYLALIGRDRKVACATLSVKLSPHLAPDAAYFDFLRLLARTISTAIQVSESRDAEREHAQFSASMAEALQRSLLSAPRDQSQVDIAVRYVPATEEAQVGGDWYDAFHISHGATSVVIGDVSGHDQKAAAVMAQVRNILRGIGYTTAATPAGILKALDGAMRDLPVAGLATAVLGILENDEDGTVFRWANAGHPPPLLLLPDTGPQYLEDEPDVLLGMDADLPRFDHFNRLPMGATVLLFTDGLIERRGARLEDGMHWLTKAASEYRQLNLEAFCDALLAEVKDYSEDDIALLAIRVK